MTSTAMSDVSCPKCRKRFGWRGDLKDRPPCPRCGHQVDAAVLAADQACLDEFATLLATLPGDATPSMLMRKRQLAGLSIGQAAVRLEISRSTLELIESPAN